MFICSIIHIFICLIGKNSCNFQPFLLRNCFIQFLKCIIVFSKCRNGIYCKKCCVCIFALRMHMLLMMFHNVFCNSGDSFLIMIKRCHVDIMAFTVFWIIQLFWVNSFYCNIFCKDCPLIFYRKSEHIAVCNCIFDHISVQTCIQFIPSMEHICRCTSVSTFILLKNRRSCKSYIIGFFKVFLNLRMHTAELGTMTFINDKYYFFISVTIHNLFVFWIFHSICHFLNGRNNHLFLR